MIVGVKDSVKFVGVAVMACCAVFVCSLFLNYSIDMKSIENLIEGEQMNVAYSALTMNNRVVCLVTGCSLILTTIVMLVFYVGHYVAKNSSRIGVLKALGYSDWKIASNFCVFGSSVLIGALVGFAGSWAIMPSFYVQQAKNHVLPDIIMRFHLIIPVCIVLLPTICFGALAVFIAYFKVKRPVMDLLKNKSSKSVRVRTKQGKERPFLFDISASVFGQKKSLVFFVAFGGFCVAAMLQMGLSMNDYASGMMGAIIIIIGLILAATSLYLALTTVVRGNAKTISMLKVFGYSQHETLWAVLGLYHIPSYLGFAVGSVYQWGLLNVMVNVVFSGYEDIPVYKFDWVVFIFCLIGYFVVYELLNVIYSFVIGKSPLKAVMGE